MKLKQTCLTALGAAMLLIPHTAVSQLVLSFGDLSIAENSTSETIEVFVTGDTNVQGVNFNIQIGDGGPIAGGSTPVQVTGVDILGGTIFEGNNTGASPGRLFVDGLALDGTTTNTGTVVANGLLGTVTVSTTGLTAGDSFTISTNGLNGATDFAGIAAEQATGTLTVVPEPASVATLALGAITLLRRRRAA